MGKVTDLRRGRSREKRVNVFLDGKFAFNLKSEVIVKDGLQVGQELSASQVEALTRSDHFHSCLNAANHFLSYRPRSESEVREKLQRRGFNSGIIDNVLAKLKEQGLVDDTSFAQFWRDNRESFSPRSQWLTRRELNQKGIAGEIIDRMVNEIDDEKNAYRAALSRASRLSVSDYQVFRRRLGEYLKRRGFNYEVITSTVERLWQEYGNSPR